MTSKYAGRRSRSLALMALARLRHLQGRRQEDPDGRRPRADPGVGEARRARHDDRRRRRCCCPPPRPTTPGRSRAATRPSRWAIWRSATARRAPGARRSPAASNRERLAAAPVVADGKLFVDRRRRDASTPSPPTPARRCGRVPIAKGDENRPARFGGGVSYRRRQASTRPTGWATSSRSTPPTARNCGAPSRAGRCAARRRVANGSVYVLSQDNQLFALNQADGKVAVDAVGHAWRRRACSASPRRRSAQGTVVAGFSSGELNAYRYENGRTLWQRRAVAHLDHDLGVEPVGHRRRPGDRRRPRLCGRAGRAHGRARTRHRPAAVGAEFRRHLDAVGRGRMAVRRHRRRAAVCLSRVDRQGALDRAAARASRTRRRRRARSPGSARCWRATGWC